uniref:Uncharacterized protein n=1 Tax=Coccolithus braarudii TaxID=221442 RepID=A0A7S0PYM9_9EUKA|mmetsp:Transcript_23023/g.49698  ORF Transcript_23023/g.49698 Transcript_23023/m.49698 type:complete len:100 (+) Transcript_23023:74-373(+)
MAHLLVSALSINAYVLQGPAVSPVRMNGVVMNAEPPRTSAMVGKVVPTAPKAGWSLTMAGGQLTKEMLRKAQQKAAKEYAGPDDISGVPDDLKRYSKGW